MRTSEYYASPAWQPLSVVGGHGTDGRVNAQICISISSASIVPERPRLLVVLWKQNFTHDLVGESGTLSVSLLGAEQVGLIEPLGLETGRKAAKLESVELAQTAAGDPYPAGAVGVADCVVADALDLGDATAFLTFVRHEERLSEAEPLTWEQASALLPKEVLDRYERKLHSDRELAKHTMLWAEGK